MYAYKAGLPPPFVWSSDSLVYSNPSFFLPRRIAFITSFRCSSRNPVRKLLSSKVTGVPTSVCQPVCLQFSLGPGETHLLSVLQIDTCRLTMRMYRCRISRWYMSSRSRLDPRPNTSSISASCCNGSRVAKMGYALNTSKMKMSSTQWTRLLRY